jgi:large subunit ribosomal protein L18
MKRTKEDIRTRIHRRIRKRMTGTADRPRLAIFRSQAHIYAQVIDDDKQATLAAASSLEPELEASLKGVKKTERAKHIGKLIAQRCMEKGVSQVVFDRNGFIYHGRVSALADGAREGGLKF